MDLYHAEKGHVCSSLMSEVTQGTVREINQTMDMSDGHHLCVNRHYLGVILHVIL